MPNDEWQTPPSIIEMAREVMGSIDLDPASSEEANEAVKAKFWSGKEEDGLSYRWPNGNIWLNPPYSQPACYGFVSRLCEHCCDRMFNSNAILLINNSTETKGFQLALSSCSAMCLPCKRISFWLNGRPCNQNRQGQVFFYFGDRVLEFCKTFKVMGKVITLKYCF